MAIHYKYLTYIHELQYNLFRQKGRAEVFEKQIRRALGRFRMVYTRTPEGRKILLRARTRSFVNQNQRVLQGRKVAKGTFE